MARFFHVLLVWVLLASIIPLLLLSGLLFLAVDAKIDQLLEQNLAHSATEAQLLYEERQNELLASSVLVAGSLEAYGNRQDQATIQQLLQTTRQNTGADLVVLVNRSGHITYSPEGQEAGQQTLSKLVFHGLALGIPTTSTEKISKAELESLSPKLALEASIKRIPQDAQEAGGEIQHGIVIAAIAPIRDGEEVSGGVLIIDALSRDTWFVDRAYQTTGRQASIFLDDVRIATSIKTAQGNRYIGTLMPLVAYEHSVLAAAPYVGKVQAIGTTYRTAYVPLKNYQGDPVGALSIGVPEEEFSKVRFLFREREFSRIVLFSTLACIGLAGIVCLLLVHSLSRPFNDVLQAVMETSKGRFDQGIRRFSRYDELEELAKRVNMMIRDVRQDMVEGERRILQEYRGKRKK